MPKVFISAVFIHICFLLSAQAPSINPLQIGDKLPDLPITILKGGVPTTLMLSHFKGKLLILDFWDVRCASCIAAMPELDTLQHKFRGKIQILLITHNKQEEVNKLFAHIKIKKPNIPIITGDTVLNKYFPHISNPHHVWVDAGGRVQYITEGYNATAKNIQSVLDGRKPPLALKSDMESYDGSQSLLEIGASKYPKQITRYSVLLAGLQRYISGNRVEIIKDAVTGKPTTIRAVNVSVLTLYNIAFNRQLYGFDVDVFRLPVNNRTILATSDTTELVEPQEKEKIDAWKDRNIFSYELYLPASASQDPYCAMQTDLNQFFPFEGTIEKRKVKCLVLVRTSERTDIKTKSKNNRPFVGYRNGVFYIKNETLKASLLRALIYSNNNLSMPIVDETGYNEPVDLQINTRLSNIELLRKELKQYGLGLIEEERVVDMLVIKDKNGK